MDTVTLSIPLVLLAGVVSFASPCFLPVVPVFVGYMTGSQIGQAADAGPEVGQGRRRWAAAGHAGLFMASFGLVFALLWAMVGLIGWAAADYHGLLRVIGGAILVLLGLYTTGLIRLPFLERLIGPVYAPDSAQPPSIGRTVLLGLAFGAGWSPCIGPVLGGVLMLTTSTTSLASGLGLLVVFTLGLGLPFVLVCAGVSGLTARLRWFVRHRRGVNAVTGGLLILVGFLMIADLFSKLSALTGFGL
ncbi:MAG: cytochrome c biogenesis protein CcdA [Micrococcales bacterium]|nr:cytochrome c biogenesis protein CcdA [Micrococcales bacterium]